MRVAGSVPLRAAIRTRAGWPWRIVIEPDSAIATMIVGRGEGVQNVASVWELGCVLGPPRLHAQHKLAAAQQSEARIIGVDWVVVINWWDCGEQKCRRGRAGNVRPLA
jgi:hypothetical protein